VLYPGQDPWVFVQRVRASIMNTILSGALAGATCFLVTSGRREPCPEHTFNGVLGGSWPPAPPAASWTPTQPPSSVRHSPVLGLKWRVTGQQSSGRGRIPSGIRGWGAVPGGCVGGHRPYCLYVLTLWSGAAGITAGLVYLGGVWAITEKARIDDPVHASAVHLGCGVWGALCAGLWANPSHVRDTYHLSEISSCGLFYGCGFAQLGVQVCLHSARGTGTPSLS